MNGPNHGVRAVSIRHATRRYRLGSETVTALDDVSVEIYPGELTVAAGPSGSGKTTLLSTIAGYEPRDAGAVVSFNSRTVAIPGWRDLAFVPQSLALLDELTVAENIDLPARLSPGRDPVSMTDLLATLEIGHLASRFPSEVSGGEQQRTAIGRALRLNPAILLADEPTGHQDRQRVDLIVGVLRRHAYGGHVVLVASHDAAVISAADRVITLGDGRIVADTRTSPTTLPASPG